jgi:hypothetical protein
MAFIANENISIRGIVPSPKMNIEDAPLKKLPEAKAYNCMVCKGPQGIKPFSKPTIRGLDFLFEDLQLVNGSFKFIPLNNLKPDILKPIIIIKRPASIDIEA